MPIIKDPHAPGLGTWIFEWYTPDQEIRPSSLLTRLGIPTPSITPVPFLISDPDRGRKVRFRSLTGSSGPPYVPVNQEVPFLPGSQLKFINIDEAEVDLRILFTADSQTLLWASLRSFPYLFNPLRGIGILKVTNPSGEERYLNCTCISGFRLDESTLQEKSVEASLTFYANDPWWYGPWIEVINDFTPATGFFPIAPEVITGPNRTAGNFFVTTLGDVKTYAAFVFKAPYKDPVLANFTINPQPGNNNSVIFSANGGVTSTNNPLLFDCINKIATGPDSGPPVVPLANLIPKMTTTSSFFPLLPSQENRVYIEIGNRDNNSSVTMIYRNAYSTMI